MTCSCSRIRGFATLLAAAALGACDSASPDTTSTVGAWTLTAPMLEPRAGHSMTVLQDGRVLVAGGHQPWANDGTGPALASAELYDPIKGSWSPTGSMGTPRTLHASVLLPDGRALVAGGCNGFLGAEGWPGCRLLASAELYDPATGAWTATGDMRNTRSGSAVLLNDGRVLVAGSETGATWASFATGGESELYDPVTGSWAETGSMTAARSEPGLALLPSGLVLAVGGAAGASGPTAVAELYDPARGTWRPTAELGFPVVQQTMTLLPTGEVLLACGREDFWMPSDTPGRPTAWLYDPTTETWRPTSPMTYRRVMPTAVRLASGHVLLSGGNYFDFAQGGAGYYPAPGGDVYDPWLDTWTPTPAMPHYVMYWSTAVLLPDGDVLQAGGSLFDGAGFDWEDMLTISAAQRFHWDGPAAR
jgi:hypothetical protein